MHGVVWKIVKIPSICQNNVVFRIPSYSTCVVYKKRKIIHLSESEGGGYLPRKSSAPQVSTIIHLHFGELCNSTEAPKKHKHSIPGNLGGPNGSSLLGDMPPLAGNPLSVPFNVLGGESHAFRGGNS